MRTGSGRSATEVGSDDSAAGAARTRYRAGGGRRVRARLSSADRNAVAVLVVLPLVLFVVPALLGWPDITGDNLIQNFPLRALSGAQMRAGHLPLWNPYIWSGSPLLGGLNAGSFYPFTFAFVVLAPVAAWVVNLLGVYWAGGLGLYALCRQYRLRPLPSFLGAITFAFSGTMAAQVVHIALVQGTAWMPLLVLAEIRLSWVLLGTGPAKGAAEARSASPWPWVALLAALVGLEALTGEPRCIAETEIVGTAVGLWLVVRPYRGVVVAWRRRATYLGLAVLAGAWGVALAAAELAPGWSFIQLSQRSVESYSFFGAGSLPTRWSLLLFVPDLLGGAGHFGQPAYFAHYNLVEVTSYVGLLPLSAVLVLLTRTFGRRRSRASSDWGMWLVILVLGLFLAWGSSTPLGHLWQAIPLFGKTRLQSRNVEIADLALAVLLAFWLDGLCSGRAAAQRSGTAGWRLALALVPAATVVVLCAVTLAAPGAMEGWLGVAARSAHLAVGLWPWFAASMAVAAAVAVLLVGWRHFGARARRRLLVGIVVADIALLVLATSDLATRSTITLEPTHADAAAVVGTTGRFAIVQTSMFNGGAVTRIGQPDLNAFSKAPSVQGYGSILGAVYAAATGTHTFDSMTGCALARGTFGQLRLATLLAVPSELARGLGATGSVPPAPPPCSGVRGPRRAAPGGVQPAGTARQALYLGFTTALSAVTLVVAGSGSSAGPRTVRPEVAVVTPTGAVRVPRQTMTRSAAGWTATFVRAQTADGIVVEHVPGTVSESSTARGTRGAWAFDGPLQAGLDTSVWRFTGTYGQLARFVRSVPVHPPVWLTHPAPGSSVRQVRASEWGTSVDRVTATRPVTVVWSESYLPGWHARLVGRRDGRSEQVPVHRHGLVQSVRVPGGSWTLTFTYRAPNLDLGAVGTLVALAGFAGFGAPVMIDRRRARSRGIGVQPIA